MSQLEMYAVVALLEDQPSRGLVRGQVGTVVGVWVPDVYEVEFADRDGRAYAMAEVPGSALIRLLHEPASRAA